MIINLELAQKALDTFKKMYKYDTNIVSAHLSTKNELGEMTYYVIVILHQSDINKLPDALYNVPIVKKLAIKKNSA